MVQVGEGQAISLKDYVSRDQIEHWLKIVFSERAVWHNYFESINVFGRAWYLDLESGLLHQYHAEALATNSKLARLDSFVASLSAAAKYLEAPDGTVGLPAFPRHKNLGPYWAEAGLVIMTAGGMGEVHADYEGLAPYPAKLFDRKTRAYSAVLSLARPDIGGNLKVWAKHRLGNEEPELEDYTVEIIDYTPGSLAIFDSFCYHQILASEMTDSQPYRAVGAMHFLYMEEPEPHWQYWF